MQEKETVESEIQNRPDGSFTMKIGRTTYEVVSLESLVADGVIAAAAAVQGFLWGFICS